MDMKEFPRRRKKLMDMMGDDSIAILPTTLIQIGNIGVEFSFKQDSDFYYLTGFPEPEAVAILIPGRANGEYVLFCRERDKKMETWYGRRAGLEDAIKLYAADDAFPTEDLNDILPGLLEDKERIFYTIRDNAVFDQRVVGWVKQVRAKERTGIHAPDELVSLKHILHNMRLYKSRQEIKAIREAVKISVNAHKRAMKACRPGMMEYEIEAELTYEFMRHGVRSPAYTSIVGGGENSCILHYTKNSDELKEGDILLIDAGAEYDKYTSDITRTVPINGKFTIEQRTIYDVVLTGQLAAIEQVKPGNHWNDPHDAAVEVIAEGLLELGILKGQKEKVIKDGAYSKFYIHHTSHWLGMDVHDVGDYKVDIDWRLLEPGMVLTVEPGLYFSPTRGLAKKWWKIGVRIEDDVLVTENGHDILSKDLPKTADEIEAIMVSGH